MSVDAAVQGAEAGEDPGYLRHQLITYLGNKRALFGPIEAAVERVRARLGGRRLDVLDPFAGSGGVSRLLKRHARRLVTADLQPYAATLGRCFLANRSKVDLAEVAARVHAWNAEAMRLPRPVGFIEAMYAPRDEAAIGPEDRVFYTRDNARRLDFFRQRIGTAPPELRDLLLGPLLARASVHANTAGVFKGFYKDRRTGVGRFGGTGADALGRIRGRIELEVPLLSRFEAEYAVFEGDANQLVPCLGRFDLAYLDPPYNQHPYGSNYFMLDLLTEYRRPSAVSKVSGIPEGWRRSGYNQRTRSKQLLSELIDAIDAPFLLISFSNEGFVSPEDMDALLAARGRVETVELRYPTFRGCRNLAGRSLHVTERLLLVER